MFTAKLRICMSSIMRRRREVMDAPLRDGIRCCKQLFHVFAKTPNGGIGGCSNRNGAGADRVNQHNCYDKTYRVAVYASLEMCCGTFQDNASYHKKQETHDWFQANRRYVKVFQLPPYWPELNATERIWHYTRKHVTHNRFFERPQDLCRALFHRFDYARHHPQEIEGVSIPFFELDVELFMHSYIGVPTGASSYAHCEKDFTKQWGSLP